MKLIFQAYKKTDQILLCQLSITVKKKKKKKKKNRKKRIKDITNFLKKK